jgi:hypothetical protein
MLSHGARLGDSPVTPRHIPSMLSIFIEKCVGADAQLPLGDLDLRTLAGGLLAHRHAI